MTCPHKKKKHVKKKGQTTATTKVDEFASQFKKEFSLVVCLSTSTGSSVTWYIDDGASSHMTSVRDQFTELSECDVDMEVVLGDDSMVRAVGESIISFQRELQSPLSLTEVLFVLVLKKNLISVSAIEDKGYEVLFRGGHVLMYPKGSSVTSSKVIGAREGKLYRFLFQPLRALAHNTTSNSDL